MSRNRNQAVAARKLHKARQIALRCWSIDWPLPRWVAHRLKEGR